MSGRHNDEPTFGSLYRTAIWDSDLPPYARLVALAYANHAGLIYGTDRAWVAQRQLMRKTGIPSFETVNNAIKILTGRGWLVDEGHPPGRVQRRVYRLTNPDPQGQEWLDAALETATAAVAASVVPKSRAGSKTAPIRTANRSDRNGKPLRSRAKTATGAVEDVVEVSEVQIRRSGRASRAVADALPPAASTTPPTPKRSIPPAPPTDDQKQLLTRAGRTLTDAGLSAVDAGLMLDHWRRFRELDYDRIETSANVGANAPERLTRWLADAQAWRDAPGWTPPRTEEA